MALANICAGAALVSNRIRALYSDTKILPVRKGGAETPVIIVMLQPAQERWLERLPMLTDEQKKLIAKGLSKGVTDTQIAEAIGLKHMQVFNYRKSLGVTSAEVVDWRYDTWIRMLEAGMSVDLVASLYKVKPDTVLNSLYRKRDFSYAEAKKRGQKALEVGFRKAMGITARDLQEQRLQAWVKLFDSGMTVEAIADIYGVKPLTVERAIRKASDSAIVIESVAETFDW